jgi:hypothetical protein
VNIAIEEKIISLVIKESFKKEKLVLLLKSYYCKRKFQWKYQYL